MIFILLKIKITKCSVQLTCDKNGDILDFSLTSFWRDFSITEGNEINRKVCPVGAVSKTTTEKSIPRTSLKKIINISSLLTEDFSFHFELF